MRGDYMLSAVSRAINAEFANTLSCYAEVPAQGCTLPYIFVHELQQEQTPDNNRRFNRFCFFDIRYHPDDKKQSKNRETTIVREKLLECLHLIQTDDLPARASGIRAEMVDSVLHVFADYPLRIMAPKPSVPNMQTLETTENIKKE